MKLLLLIYLLFMIIGCSTTNSSNKHTNHPEVIFITMDSDSYSKIGKSKHTKGKTSRKPIAEMLRKLRQADVQAVFLDYGYKKRTDDPETKFLAAEFEAFSANNSPPLLYICDPENFFDLKDVEPFVHHARFGSCKQLMVAPRDGSRYARYCTPETKNPSDAWNVSPNPENKSYSKNRTCSRKDKNIVVTILEDMGVDISPKSFNRSSIMNKDNSRTFGRALDIPLLPYYKSHKLIDFLSDSFPIKSLKGKVIFFGSAVPGQDEESYQGGKQYGIYGHIAVFEFLMNNINSKKIRDFVKFKRSP